MQTQYFLYARKSSESEDKQTASIESQVNELTKLAEEESLKIVKVFSEAKSAKEPGRKQFNKMIEQIKQGKAQGIICWKLDRLARNPIDGGEISWLLQQGLIQHIRTSDRHYYPTDNVMMMAVEFGVSNQFVRDLSDNTKRGLRKKAADGHLPTYSPLGYIHDPLAPKGKKYIIADPERFKTMQKAFRMVASGKLSPMGARDKAINDWGLRTKFGNHVAISSWYRQLGNPFYYGKFEYPRGSGEWHLGKHPPMISKAEFDKIQEILKSNYRAKPAYLKHIFNGFVKCGECSASVGTEIKKKVLRNGKKKTYTFCRCTKKVSPDCSQRYSHQEDLEAQFIEILETFEIPESFGRWIIKYLKWKHQEQSQDQKKVMAEQRRCYDRCTERLDRLIDMRAEDLITTDEFLERKADLMAEKATLQELINDSDAQVTKNFERAEEKLDFAAKAKAKFENGGLQEKREVLEVFGAHLVLKDQKLECKLPPVYQVLQKLPTKPKQLPQINRESLAGSDIKLWLPMLDKFRTVNWKKVKNNVEQYRLASLLNA